MASAKTVTCKSCNQLQLEHREMWRKLSELDAALESLICYSEVFADLAGVQQAQDMARWLAVALPEHFVDEERGVLAQIGRQGAESAAFSREMKRQHKEISARVETFRQAAHTFQEASDLQQSICNLKEAGNALATFITAHIGAEERKFATL
jgi:hypothetical protein